jgi:hypothetical protein
MWRAVHINFGWSSAIVGGVLWCAQAVAVALLPEGCVGSDCYQAGRSMRDWSHLAPIFMLAGVLIGVGLVDLVGRARDVGRLGRMGQSGIIATGGGVGVIAAASLVQMVFYGGDFPQMPFFVLPGILLLTLGVLVLGIAILRAAILPSWVARLMIAGALALLAYNDQDARVLMSIPFGLSSIGVGHALRSMRRADTPGPG